MSAELSPNAQKALDRFLSQANLGMLHPLDWDRFYRFARVCYIEGVELDEGDLKRILGGAGFGEAKAVDIASLFYHLMEFQAVE